jgi:hypothetical protein
MAAVLSCLSPNPVLEPAQTVNRSLPEDQEAESPVLTNIMNASAATAKIGWNRVLQDPHLESMLPAFAPRRCRFGEKTIGLYRRLRQEDRAADSARGA